MNHFSGILIFALCVATVFALVNREGFRDRVNYFLTLIAYMVAGSLLFSWVMYLLPF